MAGKGTPYKDQMPGGYGDEKTPEDFDQDQLKKGVEIEREHTEDPLIALEIAVDHLTEDPHYYDLLEQIEPQNSPSPPDDRLKWYSWTGYGHESMVLNLLAENLDQQATQVHRELVAEWAPRFRGHIDHELPDGTLLELKSVYWEKLLRLMASGRAEAKNEAQVQSYMRHGGYDQAIILYTARNVPHKEFYRKRVHVRGNTWLPGWTPPFWAVDIIEYPAMQDSLDDKARNILRCYDEGTPPLCSCGYCK